MFVLIFGKDVIVVVYGNSLCVFVKLFFVVFDDDIMGVEILIGNLFLIEFDDMGIKLVVVVYFD